MRKAFALALAFCLVSTTSLMACHSNYFDEVFTNYKKMQRTEKLDKHQLLAMMQFKANFNKSRHADHNGRNAKGCAAHDSHVPTFIAAAAGVLNDTQFKKMTGKAKTENQKLHFEINELKRELAELKKLVKELQAK